MLSGATAGLLVASYLGMRALRTHRTRVARWTSQAIRRIEERVQVRGGRCCWILDVIAILWTAVLMVVSGGAGVDEA